MVKLESESVAGALVTVGTAEDEAASSEADWMAG